MKAPSRLKDWVTAWRKPVLPELVLDIETASKEAAAALGETQAYPFELLVGRKNVAFLDLSLDFTHIWKIRLARLVQGVPVSLRLWQKDASGLVGPFAKTRKNKRSNSMFKENALIFWPSPQGKIDEVETQSVLKVALGAANCAREIRMLRMVRQMTGFAPGIKAHDPKLKWLVIDFIGNARRQNDAEQARLYVEKIAEKYFRAWGTGSRPTRYYLKRRFMSEERFVTLATELGISDTARLLDGSLTWSIAHRGGITEECLLAEDGKVYLLDWEKAAFAPIAVDLVKVFPYEPAATIEIFNKFVSKDTLSAADQLRVGAIFRFAHDSAKRFPSAKKLKLDHTTARLLREL